MDGEGQSRKAPAVAESAINANFFSDRNFDYACGIYDDVFGKERVKSAVHKREVLFVKPDFFVVADTLSSADGRAHDYTMLLHMDTLDVRTTEKSILGVLKGKYNLCILPLMNDIKIGVDSGKNDPVSGWYVGRNDKDLHPASTVRITVEQRKDHRFLTLLFPVKKGKALPSAKRISESTWQIVSGEKISTLDLADLTANFSAE